MTRARFAVVLHFSVERAFEDLLFQWRAHQVLTSKVAATVPQRAASRERLDRARERVSRLRLAIHPEDHEAESVVEQVWCEALETVVHLRWLDQHPTRPGNFSCACGGLIPIDWDRLGID